MKWSVYRIAGKFGGELKLVGFNRVLVSLDSADLPDLVPNLEVFKRSVEYYRYVDRLPMYYLTCSLEENCLSRSAYGQSQNHIRLVAELY